MESQQFIQLKFSAKPLKIIMKICSKNLCLAFFKLTIVSEIFILTFVRKKTVGTGLFKRLSLREP